MRLAIYIDFLSLPSRQPRRERSRVSVTKTSIPGAHQESISIDEGQLTFCPTSSYIRSPWNCVGEDSLRVSRLLALFDRDEIRACEEVNCPFSEVFLYLKEIPSEESVSVSCKKDVSYRDI